MTLPAVASVTLAINAMGRWYPSHSVRPPVFGYTRQTLEQTLWVGEVLSYMAVLAVAFALGAAIVGMCSEAMAARMRVWPLFLALPAAGAPALVRIVLPWEDPYSGGGSPLATALAVLTLSAIGAAFFAPGAVLVLWGSRRERA